MKKYLLALLVLPVIAFAQVAGVDSNVWESILTFLLGLAPWVKYLFLGLGTLVVVGTIVDQLVPDEKDHGFMKKAFAIPLLGDLLKALSKFSPFNFKDPTPPTPPTTPAV